MYPFTGSSCAREHRSGFDAQAAQPSTAQQPARFCAVDELGKVGGSSLAKMQMDCQASKALFKTKMGAAVYAYACCAKLHRQRSGGANAAVQALLAPAVLFASL
mmetsp:Transcript_92800/g.278398  ORF Transcript_92800/g.278398 Transcript_92800/m.278398 type:complete len:104 (-) Transcript_92800:17-328(-)